jgi:ketosteroid isomerase-like protein
MVELEGLRERMEAFFDAMERADIGEVKSILDAIVAPDCEFTSAVATELSGQTYRGRDEIRRYFAELVEMFDLSYEERQFSEPRPGTLVVLVDFTARSRSTGMELEYGSGYVFEVEDGLITTSSTFLSHGEALEAANA